MCCVCLSRLWWQQQTAATTKAGTIATIAQMRLIARTNCELPITLLPCCLLAAPLAKRPQAMEREKMCTFDMPRWQNSPVHDQVLCTFAAMTAVTASHCCGSCCWCPLRKYGADAASRDWQPRQLHWSQRWQDHKHWCLDSHLWCWVAAETPAASATAIDE